MPQAVRAITIFVLLIAFMLTGMPVSISLGLTVLTFLFMLSDVPIEAVSMKLFTGLESFEIMAIPFFILAGDVPQPRRRRAPHDQFRGVAGRPLARRARARRHRRLRDVRPGVRIERRHRGGDRRDRAARDGAARLPDAVRRRHHHGRGLARHPDAAVDPEDRLRGLHQHLDRRAVRRRPASRLDAHRHAVRGDLVSSPEARTIRAWRKRAGARPGTRSARASGA